MIIDGKVQCDGKVIGRYSKKADIDMAIDHFTIIYPLTIRKTIKWYYELGLLVIEARMNTSQTEPTE